MCFAKKKETGARECSSTAKYSNIGILSSYSRSGEFGFAGNDVGPGSFSNAVPTQIFPSAQRPRALFSKPISFSLLGLLYTAFYIQQVIVRACPLYISALFSSFFFPFCSAFYLFLPFFSPPTRLCARLDPGFFFVLPRPVLLFPSAFLFFFFSVTCYRRSLEYN